MATALFHSPLTHNFCFQFKVRQQGFMCFHEFANRLTKVLSLTHASKHFSCSLQIGLQQFVDTARPRGYRGHSVASLTQVQGEMQGGLCVYSMVCAVCVHACVAFVVITLLRHCSGTAHPVGGIN
jgi:hypothetical protein